jgi:hypothetical protein
MSTISRLKIGFYMISPVIFYWDIVLGLNFVLHWVKIEFHNRGEEWFDVDN